MEVRQEMKTCISFQIVSNWIVKNMHCIRKKILANLKKWVDSFADLG